MKKVLMLFAAWTLLGSGSCLMMGCSYTIEHTGTTTHKAQVAGAGEECAVGEDGEEVCEEKAALSALMKFDNFSLKFKGDPASFIERVLNDGAGIVKKIISLFGPPAVTAGV